MNATVYSTAQNRYEFYEKQSKSQYNRRCIDGTITGCNKCVGYCQYNGHSGFLTKEQRAQHECIAKGCNYYVPKPKYDEKQERTYDITSIILTEVAKDISANEGVRIMRVVNTNFKQYSVFYITITNELDFEKSSVKIKKDFGVNLNFVKLDYDFDRCAALIYTGLGEAV